MVVLCCCKGLGACQRLGIGHRSRPYRHLRVSPGWLPYGCLCTETATGQNGDKERNAGSQRKYKISQRAIQRPLALAYNGKVKRLLLGTIFGSFAAIALQAQSAPSLATDLKGAYKNVKNNLLGSAEKMPEENYSFKPTPDIRSFAEVLDHVVVAQMHACGAVVGEQKAGNGQATSKADVIAALNAAFAECDKAYDGLTDANASDAIKTPRGERSRIGVLAGNLVHDTEQYGIISVYLRLKGIVPPSSDEAARKK